MEAFRTLLKNTFFRKKDLDVASLLKEKNFLDYRDELGNNLAHHCILLNHLESLERLHPLLDLKNKRGISPKDLLRHLLNKNDLKSPAAIVEVFRTKENSFETFDFEKIQDNFKFNYVSELKFDSAQNLKLVLERSEKILLNENIKRKNLWIDSLYGSPFLFKRLPQVYIKWINPLVGYGLFAKEDIPQYSLVGEYTGVVRRRNKKLDFYNDYIFGYVIADQETPFVIDAFEQGNHTRFINHSLDPNLYSTWLIHKGVCHILLVTKFYIKKGEQITLDYGVGFWKKRIDPLIL